MSRWGHSMLRLVICAPGRARGPDCRLDLQYHRVLSFRAFVGDVQISSWRGLTGSYPSRLFVLPLEQVIEEYTKVELRGLQSIPLAAGPGRDRRPAGTRRAAALELRRPLLLPQQQLRRGDLQAAARRRAAAGRRGSVQHHAHWPAASAGARRHRRCHGAGGSREALRLGYYFEALSARYQAMFEVARQALQLPQATRAGLAGPARGRARAVARARRPARERRTAAARAGRTAPAGTAGAR